MERPTEYSPEIVDAICDRMAEGKGLVEICSAPDMPGRSTVYRWIESNADFRRRHAKAREAQMDYYAELILKIAFDESGDVIYDQDKDGKTSAVANHAKVQRDRLKVDTLKWTAARLFPKRYGDKFELLAAVNETDEPRPAIVSWEPSVRLITYPMVDPATDRFLRPGTPEHDAAVEAAIRQARAMGQTGGVRLTTIEAEVGFDLNAERKAEPPAPPQITFQPAPMPGDLPPEDWETLIEVLALIKRVQPVNDEAEPGEVFQVLRKALLDHYATETA